MSRSRPSRGGGGSTRRRRTRRQWPRRLKLRKASTAVGWICSWRASSTAPAAATCGKPAQCEGSHGCISACMSLCMLALPRESGG
eukprot:252748-Pleurochrysis_carterae.AAC.1